MQQTQYDCGIFFIVYIAEKIPFALAIGEARKALLFKNGIYGMIKG